MRNKIIIMLTILVFFYGCNSFFSNSYTLDVVVEKKVQASRKSEIIKDNRVEITTIVTHLNEVSPLVYNHREYFFVEIYDENQANYKGMIDYTLNGIAPIWVREILEDEFDEILRPHNKWSKCYLLAFDVIDRLSLREMVLQMQVFGLGVMQFDFGFKALPMQF